MSKVVFFVIDHKDSTEKSVGDLARDMIGGFIDDIVLESKENSDFSLVETDLDILNVKVKEKYKNSSFTKPMRLFKIEATIKTQEIGKD